MRESTDSIGDFLDRFAEAWQSSDGQTLAAAFVDDGTLINPFGQRADGRDAVAAMYGEFFEGMLAGTSTTVRVESTRDADERHVLVDAEQSIAAADGAVVLVVHLTALVRREGEGWRFVDSRPYTFAAIPA